MAYNIEGIRFPARAASQIGQYVPVRFVGDPHFSAGSALSEVVVAAGSTNQLALGMTTAAATNPGDEISVQFTGIAKAVCGASLGAGAPVGVGSTNGILIPVQASGGAGTTNQVQNRFVVGIAVKNAAAGDVFPVLLKPDQIV